MIPIYSLHVQLLLFFHLLPAGLRCHLDDACTSTPCKYGAMCETSPFNGGAICTCPPGWNGTDCSIDINECTESGKLTWDYWRNYHILSFDIKLIWPSQKMGGGENGSAIDIKFIWFSQKMGEWFSKISSLSGSVRKCGKWLRKTGSARKWGEWLRNRYQVYLARPENGGNGSARYQV